MPSNKGKFRGSENTDLRSRLFWSNTNESDRSISYENGIKLWNLLLSASKVTITILSGVSFQLCRSPNPTQARTYTQTRCVYVSNACIYTAFRTTFRYEIETDHWYNRNESIQFHSGGRCLRFHFSYFSVLVLLPLYFSQRYISLGCSSVRVCFINAFPLVFIFVSFIFHFSLFMYSTLYEFFFRVSS